MEDSDGAMVVPFVSGLDKTTVSVQTGSQEYHPFYVSPGNLTNVARRGHGNGVIPVAFIPISKSTFVIPCCIFPILDRAHYEGLR